VKRDSIAGPLAKSVIFIVVTVLITVILGPRSPTSPA
jgi:hypothetical protein